MDKEKMKKLKAAYFPYKAMKKVVFGLKYYFNYSCSLHYIKRNKKRVQKKIKCKETLNVVFIVQYIPSWNKLEPLYTKMKQDNRYNPFILCVPLNIQNHILTGDNGNDTYEYFINHGYEAIDSLQVPNTWYDLRLLKPDYVFHSRPYNHFMPVEYTSGVIVRFALICNVIYGTCITKNGLDLTLDRNYFKDAYMYYAFDNNERDFYENRFKWGFKRGIQKCFPFGSMGMEQVLEVERVKEKSEFAKTVLWTPRWSTDMCIGGSNFFNYKDVLIGLAKDYQNVLFVFRPHPLMFENFIRTGEMSQEEVDGFKKYCENEKNILLDESKEYSNTFWNSDFLITDASGIVPEYFVTKKPIMYCHTSALLDYVEYSKEMIKSCYEVKNEKDLISHFLSLIDDSDAKLKLRMECLEKYFANVKCNSFNILNSLGNGDL